MILNSTLLIIIVFGLVFGYLYFYYNNNNNNNNNNRTNYTNDKFIDSASSLVGPDLTFIQNNDFLNEINTANQNLITFNNNYSNRVLDNLNISSDRMALSKIIVDKTLLDKLVYKRDKNDYELTYKLSKRPVVY